MSRFITKAGWTRHSTPIKPTSIPLRTFSSPVLLSNLSYYDLRFYDQPEDDPYQFVCVRMCESNPCLRPIKV